MHVLVLVTSAPEGAKAKEEGGDSITRDRIIDSSADSEKLRLREGPATDDTRKGYPLNLDERPNTKNKKDSGMDEPRLW